MAKQGFDKDKVRAPELGERSLTLPELAELVRPRSRGRRCGCGYWFSSSPW